MCRIRQRCLLYSSQQWLGHLQLFIISVRYDSWLARYTDAAPICIFRGGSVSCNITAQPSTQSGFVVIQTDIDQNSSSSSIPRKHRIRSSRSEDAPYLTNYATALNARNVLQSQFTKQQQENQPELTDHANISTSFQLVGQLQSRELLQLHNYTPVCHLVSRHSKLNGT